MLEKLVKAPVWPFNKRTFQASQRDLRTARSLLIRRNDCRECAARDAGSLTTKLDDLFDDDGRARPYLDPVRAYEMESPASTTYVSVR